MGRRLPHGSSLLLLWESPQARGRGNRNRCLPPAGDYGLSGWAIDHPLAVAMNRSEHRNTPLVGVPMQAVSEFRVWLTGRPGIGPDFASFRGLRNPQSAGVRLQQRRRVVSTESVSLQSHPAPCPRLGLACAGRGPTACRTPTWIRRRSASTANADARTALSETSRSPSSRRFARRRQGWICLNASARTPQSSSG
jgi:hypothetical protein